MPHGVYKDNHFIIIDLLYHRNTTFVVHLICFVHYVNCDFQYVVAPGSNGNVSPYSFLIVINAAMNDSDSVSAVNIHA